MNETDIKNNIGQKNLIVKTLSNSALDIIDGFLNLRIEGNKINCPYYNNRRQKSRAALRVMVGKGSCEEIIEEAKLFAFKDKVDFRLIKPEKIKEFLVDHNLGIDCSGFAFYILEAEARAQKNLSLKNKIRFPFIKNPFRKIIAKLRTVENAGVRTLSHEANSIEIDLKNIQPGDMISMIGSENIGNPNHILVIHKIQYLNNEPIKIFYSHSRQWSADGKYNHGVKQGLIEIADTNKMIIDQKWTEEEKTGESNETYIRAKQSKDFKIVRLKILNKL